MSIHQKFHLDERVSDERLVEVWHAVYEGYTENWDHEALLDMAAVGGEVCSALEELVELRATLARVEALCVAWEEPYLGDFLPREAAEELRAALKR